jgi:hypothetical protein
MPQLAFSSTASTTASPDTKFPNQSEQKSNKTILLMELAPELSYELRRYSEFYDAKNTRHGAQRGIGFKMAAQ